MKRILTILIATALLVSPALADDGMESVIDSFLKTVADLESVDADKKEAAEKVVSELRGDSPGDTITEALIVLYPEYASAIESSDDEDLTSATAALEKHVASENKFLAADASFYLARTLMNHQEFERALPILESLTGDLADFTVHSGNSKYFVGVAHAGMLNNPEAIESFIDFLKTNPNAAERLQVSAWRQVQHLTSIKEGELDDISQRMDFSRRRLEIEESNQKTQEEQAKIIKMLDKLIEDAEKQEAQSSCKNCKSQSQQQQQQQQQAQNKPSKSKSEKGGTSSNPNGRFAERSFDNGNQSPWSQLRDRARDPANTAAKEKLPARYRDIVERYYEEANKASGDNR